MSLPNQLIQLADPESPSRVALEASLGPRSYKAFFKMAWPHMEPANLVWNWHFDVVCDEMEQAARREIREMVVCIPPRSGKSLLLSNAFPAWVWTWFPAAKFITASNEMTLAMRDAVKTRRLVKSEWYQKRWGPGSPYLLPGHPGVAFAGDQDNKGYYETTAGGHRFCATPGRQVTGHGADFILADDLNNILQAESETERAAVLTWWNEVIPTRLNEPDRGVKVVIQQRVHTDDVAGNCISKGYHKVVLPMEHDPKHPHLHPKDPRREKGELLIPQRVDRAAVERLKTGMGAYAAAGQLQQLPAPRDGGLFKMAWLQFVDAVPAEASQRAIRRWDLAATVATTGKDPDYTVGARVSRDSVGRFFIEDIIRFRETPIKVEQIMKATATRDGVTTAIGLPEDPGQAGKAQAQALIRALAGYNVRAIRETGDKATRARPLAAQVEAGNVFIVRGAWNKDFIEEITSFPSGSHDDQVDAVVGAFLMHFEGQTGMLDFYAAQARGAEDPLPNPYMQVERHYQG